MYARLWWKETRLFWPIWVALGVMAAGVQWLLLWSGLPDARNGFLIVLGFGWSTLYAFAVGAGVFAAEAESKTQLFLDTMPVSRRMQWTGKVSFALVTTLGLTLALTALGALGTVELNRAGYPPETLVPGGALVLLEGVAWSLLWSIVLGSSLQAALGGLFTVGLLTLFLSRGSNLYALELITPELAPVAGPRTVLAGVALGLSWLLFTRGQRTHRSGWVGRILSAPGPQFERLVWETVRESRRIWLLLAGAWAGLLLLVELLGELYTEVGFAVVFGVLTCGVAGGVSVFGPANRSQAYRFLAYHGVRPGAVWAAKLVVWAIVLTGQLFVATAIIGLTARDLSRKDIADALQASFVIFEAFVIAVLAGQLLRRSITAWLVAILAFLLLVMPQFVLYATSMIPAASLALFPLLVLSISRAWTGDWMNDLRGAARWLRLGGMMGLAVALWVLHYIGYRAFSVPDIGPPFPPRAASVAPAPLSPDQNAGPDYVRLLAAMRARDILAADRWHDEGMASVLRGALLTQIVATGWDPELEPVVTWWQARRELIEPIRRAAAKPWLSFSRSGSVPSAADRRLVEMHSLLLLLGLDNFERRSRGDVAGAWDDLRAALQSVEQLRRSASYDGTIIPLSWRTQILQWALAWAGDPRQTPAQLRAAFAELPVLLRLPPLTDSLEDEYTRSEYTLHNNPDVLISMIVGESPSVTTTWWLLRRLVAPWWERVRALRVLRLMTARQLRLAELEPWQRLAPGELDAVRTAGHLTPRKWHSAVWAADQYLEGTPLARALPSTDGLLSFHDTNILLSRALEQVVALRIWQLEHEGHYPETLAALVPGILPALPPDPYSGQRFRYRRGRGLRILPLGLSGLPQTSQDETARSQPTRRGQWLLYSVGPNGTDEEALTDHVTNSTQGDLIFPLPPDPA